MCVAHLHKEGRGGRGGDLEGARHRTGRDGEGDGLRVGASDLSRVGSVWVETRRRGR